jgi:hypothetical protein
MGVSADVEELGSVGCSEPKAGRADAALLLLHG